IPRRGTPFGDVVVLEVVLDRRKNHPPLLVDDHLPDLDDAGPRPGDDAARRDVAAVATVEDQDAIRRLPAAEIDAIRHDDAVVDAVDGHAVDVPDLRLGAAEPPDRCDVAARRPREHEHTVIT